MGQCIDKFGWGEGWDGVLGIWQSGVKRLGCVTCYSVVVSWGVLKTWQL